MLNPDKNTPADAYEVQFGVTAVTCRPTLYWGLAYLGVSGVTRPIANAQSIEAASPLDFALFGACLTIAFVMAQILEYNTRPLRNDGVANSIRRDRAARVCNLIVGLGGVPTSLLTGGLEWGGHLAAICLIVTSTATGELLYHLYGKHNRYQPRRRARRTRTQPRTVG